MRGRAIIPLVVGLGVGVFAIKLFVNVLQKAKGATAETVSVVCATVDIEPTLEVQESMIEIKQVPTALTPKLCFADKAEVVGRVTHMMIPKGMPVVPSLLAPKGTPPGMAVRIQDGFRAVAVNIDESVGVAGWMKPGCRVDVVVMMNINRGSGRTEGISKVILQNVEVLAVGQELISTGDTAANLTRSVTLLVSPDDVPKLHLATSEGKLRLAMRNQRDNSLPTAKITTDNDLMMSAGERSARQPKTDNSSLFNRLFGAQAKPAVQPTDKTKVVRTPVPAPVAVEPQPEPWTVELVCGSQEPKKVVFADDKKNARRVGGDGFTGANTEPLRSGIPMQSPTGKPLAPAEPTPSQTDLPDAGKIDALKSLFDSAGSKDSIQAQPTENE